ncbi:hypothetical protein TrispH2_003512 [Trichoplax sp. H2]|uniref:Chromatin modification-related protein MEAF6 n=1 Tax=Trichoplax adhaerens TaxID=10228 RepID=B3SAX9_TRIAD|nr:predicted protein [Trichoplax adhaerens]XP_002118693.1 predicted protein [Trichoplax adhaerens]EDV18821.1 predicted protein [Trichoplax adhaerens]EDV20008.1 predicted protein [Trichoplax adhaerens]RDD45577.1 hypothetical protein TrispH2_003512 [Trichoplax sp. H2]|eukprot:XP_002117392.1 predicted protein [Trichoplax adhaerens]
MSYDDGVSQAEYCQLIQKLKEIQANKEELTRNLQDIEYQIYCRERKLFQTSRKFGNVATGLKVQAIFNDSSQHESDKSSMCSTDCCKYGRQRAERSHSSLDAGDDCMNLSRNSPGQEGAMKDEFIFSLSSMTSPIYQDYYAHQDDDSHDMDNSSCSDQHHRTNSGSQLSPPFHAQKKRWQGRTSYDQVQDLSETMSSHSSSVPFNDGPDTLQRNNRHGNDHRTSQESPQA